MPSTSAHARPWPNLEKGNKVSAGRGPTRSLQRDVEGLVLTAAVTQLAKIFLGQSMTAMKHRSCTMPKASVHADFHLESSTHPMVRPPTCSSTFIKHYPCLFIQVLPLLHDAPATAANSVLDSYSESVKGAIGANVPACSASAYERVGGRHLFPLAKALN